jgi:hypothetical protein
MTKRIFNLLPTILTSIAFIVLSLVALASALITYRAETALCILFGQALLPAGIAAAFAREKGYLKWWAYGWMISVFLLPQYPMPIQFLLARGAATKSTTYRIMAGCLICLGAAFLIRILKRAFSGGTIAAQ